MFILTALASAATPTLTDVPQADRPPMIAGEAVCVATITHDASGAVTGAAVADCPELFAASTRMAAEKVTLSGVDAAGAVTLRYAFDEEGAGIPSVDPSSMPVVGLPYTGIEVVEQKAPKYPKKAEQTGPVTCVVALTVGPEGEPKDIEVTECPELFAEEVTTMLEKKWRFQAPQQAPEGGARTEITVTVEPK